MITDVKFGCKELDRERKNEWCSVERVGAGSFFKGCLELVIYAL